MSESFDELSFAEAQTIEEFRQEIAVVPIELLDSVCAANEALASISVPASTVAANTVLGFVFTFADKIFRLRLEHFDDKDAWRGGMAAIQQAWGDYVGDHEKTRKALREQYLAGVKRSYLNALDRRNAVKAEERQYEELLAAPPTLDNMATEQVSRTPLAMGAPEVMLLPPASDLPATVAPVGSATVEPGDAAVHQRRELLGKFKAKARAAGIEVSNERIAKAAKPGYWNDRTPVERWCKNYKSTKDNDRLIRRLLDRDPADIWPCEAKLNHQP